MNGKPRKLPSAQITRWSRELQGNYSWLEANIPAICRANEFIDDAISGADYAAIRRGGSEGSSTERAALSDRVDDIGQLSAVFMAKYEEARRASYALRGLAVKLMVDWSDPDKRAAAEMIARRSAEPVGANDCANCGRVVSAARGDRIRRSRCEACYRYWDRHGRREERPKHLWDGMQCAATYTDMAAGVVKECVLLQDHITDHQWAQISEGAA